MEQYVQFLLDFSAIHIQRYGFYMPGEPYRLVLWNDALVVILLIVFLIMLARVKRLKRMLTAACEKANVVEEVTHGKDIASFSCGESSKMSLVMDAMKEGSSLEIIYRGADGRVTVRVVEPLKLYQMGTRVYLQAYCHLRREEREFRVDRVHEIRLIDGHHGYFCTTHAGLQV